MNEIQTRVLEGEVLGPEHCVRVIGRSKAFKAGIIDREFPSGLTVAELLDAALEGERSSFQMNYLVCVNGQPIPAEWRTRVRVKAGTVTFSPRLGDSGLARSIGLIALSVIALIVAPYIAGPALLGFTVGTTAFTVATAVISAGIVLAGSLAVNALFPIAPPELAAAPTVAGRSNAFAISGARNQADPYGTIPAVFGRVRVWPRYGALPFTEYVGTDQYLRLLFCVGYGPLSLSDFKIGETDIDSFEDVDMEVFNGYESDGSPTLYPGQVFQDALSIELLSLDSGDNWSTRTTANEIDEILVDISLPNGYFKVDSAGKTKANQLSVQIEYSVHNANTWLALGSIDDSIKNLEASVFGFRVAVARGQYDVRVQKTSDNSVASTKVADVFWISLKGLRGDPPIAFHKPLALIALRIKASGQLNNVIDSFNCIAESRVTAFTGGSPDWQEDTPSNNNADIFRWILQGAAIYRPVPDEQIDFTSLEGWHAYNVAQGWTYNREHDDRMSVFNALRMVASAGRARVTRTDGKWGVIWDDADVPVAQHFTPRNSWGLEETRVYVDPPHAFRVNFINEDKGYIADERRVYADGYTEANATKFEAVEFPGVTSTENIWRLGRFQMAQARLRPSIYSLMTNWQALSCTVGSRVYCAHDVTLWGLAQARVIAADGDVITVDEDFVFELGTEYLLRFRQADGTSVLRSITEPDSVGVHRTFTLSSDIVLPSPEVGDLVMFGEDVSGPAVLLRVLEIEWQTDLRAKLTLVDDAPGIADADSGTIPAFDSQITAPEDLFLRSPSAIFVRELVYVQDGASHTDAIISWLALATEATSFEVQIKNEGDAIPQWSQVGVVPATQLTITASDLDTGTYSFRVRTFFLNGSYSDWTTLNLVPLIGSLARPSDVENFRISVLGDSATLTWDAIVGQAVAYYVLRHSPATVDAAWGSASILLPKIIGSTAQVPAINGTYLIKAVTSEGTESLSPALIIFTGQNIVLLNNVETLTPESSSPPWDGMLTNLHVDSGTDNLILLGADGSGTYYYDDGVDLGDIFTSRVSASILAFGENPSNVMSSWVPLSSVDNLAGSTPADWRVEIDERHTDDNPIGSPAPVWSPWTELQLSDITARAFEFRLILTSLNPDIDVNVVSADVTVDMPDRIDALGDLAIPNTGSTITFSTPFRHLETVVVTAIQNAGSGDYAVVSNRTEAGFDIIVKNSSNVGVARTVDAVAAGYGRTVV